MSEFASRSGADKHLETNEQSGTDFDAWNTLSGVEFNGEDNVSPDVEQPVDSDDNVVLKSGDYPSDIYENDGVGVDPEVGETIYEYIDRLGEFGALGIQARGKFTGKEIANEGSSDKDALLRKVVEEYGDWRMLSNPKYLSVRNRWRQNTLAANDYENFDELNKEGSEALRREEKKAALALEMSRTSEIRRAAKFDITSLREDVSRVLAELDSRVEEGTFDGYELADLTGVTVGIKQAGALICSPEHVEDIRAAVDRLGLEQTAFGDLLIFGKDRVSVDGAKDLFDKSTAERQIGSKTRELGKMLGYPESATDYFIKRGMAKIAGLPLEAGMGPFYIHSPDKYEEECMQYELPLLAHLEKYCPNAAKSVRKIIEDDRKDYYYRKLQKIEND